MDEMDWMTNNKLVQFDWGRPASGFEWRVSPEKVKDSASQAFELVPKVPLDRIITSDSYLEEHTGLFRQFGSLKTPQQILEFANTFGNLGLNGCTIHSNEIEPESLIDWEFWAREVDFFIKVLDVIKTGDDAIAAKCIEWNNETPNLVINGCRDREVVGNCMKLAGVYQLKADIPNDKFSLWVLSIWMQTHLIERMKDLIAIKFSQSMPSISVSFGLSITTLFGAIWYQIALSFTGQGELRECPTCGKPFEVSPGADRKNKDYCSANCRTKAYHRRKAQAIRLSKEGKSAEQIADEVGSDASSIRRWIIIEELQNDAKKIHEESAKLLGEIDRKKRRRISPGS